MLKIRDDRQLRSLTGVNEKVLDKLEAEFTRMYQEHQKRTYRQALAQKQRQRKVGGGRKGVLREMRSKLYFILYYLKNYPSFDVMAEKFHLSRSNAHANGHKLMPILSDTLQALGYLPKHQDTCIEEVKAVFEAEERLLIDVTERECCRPKDEVKQKEHDSGKQGYHTNKNTVIANAEKVVLFMGQTFAGRNHDYAMFKAEFPSEDKWFENNKLDVDLGYQGIKTDYPEADIAIPFKKPRKSKKHPNPQLSDEQKDYNRAVSRARIYVENAICGIKRFNILVHRFRNRLEGFVDDVIVVCAGLWNALLL